MKIIYEPKGRAREYSPLAANLYKGCSHACLYCYAPSATFVDRDSFNNPIPRKDVLKYLDLDAESYFQDPRPILLCFSCDPYQPLETTWEITRRAIGILNKNECTIAILTKGGERAVRDFDLLSENPKNTFGTSLTFFDDELSKKYEPGAALPGDRISAIKKAHDLGIETWVSLEPLTLESPRLIQETYGFVDRYKIGKMNHWPEPWGPNLWEILDECIEILREKNKTFYIKKDTRAFCKEPLRSEEMVSI